MTDARGADGAGARAALLGGGPVGQDLLAVDWEATPLGAPETWPRSLATVLRALLTTRFSMWMAWGEELTFFCNDAYRRDTLGAKYPWALGRPAGEVWAEIWDDIGPRIAGVMATGVATWDEALLLLLERSGYTEETYHTFSYSPLTGDDGRIAGMLCVVSEDTDRVIAERRMATLRDLGSDPARIRTEGEVLAAARRHLAANPRSLPFTLTYLFDEGEGQARLASATGIADGHPAAPPVIELGTPGPWPADALAEGQAVTIDDLPERFADLPRGAWTDPPQQALAVPLRHQGRVRPLGFLVAALNRYRPLDDDYRAFVGLIAGQISAGIGSARAYEDERRRAETLAELDRAKTAFFTNVSHELRTPLTLLLGPAEDALADETEPLAAAQRHRVELVHRNAQRLLKLVNTLLDFSRLQSGGIATRYEPVDLARYTAELASMFHSAVQRAGLELVVDCPPLPEPVHVDREMWAKIVLNLLSNALKFTFSGTITVRVGAPDGVPTLTVSDTGIGIEPGEQARLFERFRRVVGAHARTHEGSGIGLALVAELAAMHGGEVSVESAPGVGSSFTVRMRHGTGHLPDGEVVDEAPADAVPVERHAAGFLAEALRWLSPDELEPAVGASDGDRPRVLVVDDNADMRGYIMRLLAGSYAVEGAPDGAVALRMARAEPPDLVLTDVMMPNLDGFGLLAALHDDPATTHVPVVMVSARAGEDGTIEGLEAGADDYLVKPFAARELLARVAANLELDRVRRTRDQLERSGQLLDQAQRLAGVGSWELDVATGAIRASEEFVRQTGLTEEELLAAGGEVLIRRLHPDDADRAREALRSAVETGAPVDLEVRLVAPDGSERTFRTLGEVERDTDGRPVRLHGSNQDVTEQRRAEQALTAVAAEREATARERTIADELQRSLLPVVPPVDHLEVAAYYQPGVEGTQVGGDWYDVIELGAGRTALVLGDVMGRGVRAAAVMGQLRAAVRAYARLDLPPADVLEFLDGVVRDLGEDQIATCVYAIYDPREGVLTYANAGHLPPLLAVPGEPVRRLEVGGPPLGAGPLTLTEDTLALGVGARVALYTDGLVERRERRIDAGIDALAELIRTGAGPIEDLPAALVDALVPGGTDDDVAVLVARVPEEAEELSAGLAVEADAQAVPPARAFVDRTLGGWRLPRDLIRDAVLLATEMVANAIVHGRPPITLRLRLAAGQVLLEVGDGATVPPRKLRPAPEDEHGRGLQLVAMLSERWGTRPLRNGKSVWCLLPLSRYGPGRASVPSASS